MSDSTLIPVPVSARARAKGRIGVAFGRRFVQLFLLGLVWLAPAFAQPRFVYAMLAWDLLVLAAWALDLSHLPRPGQLNVARSWISPPALSVAGNIEITLANAASSTVIAELTDNVPAQLRRDVATVSLKAAPRGEATASYEITPATRGDATIGSAYLRYESPYHLAQRWAVAPIEQTVRTYPNLDEAKKHAIYLVRSRQIQLEKRYTRIRGAGREFESLREYREGDEFRDICWTASARRAKLVTRIYQIERSQTIWIAIDCGRLMRARIGGFTKLDYATTAALSLAQVALYSGDRVGLLAYGRGVRERVLPGRGGPHLRHIIDGLAQIKEETAEADHLQAAGALLSSQKRRSLVVWLTDLAETAMTPEVVEAASEMMPRHLVLFTVIGQPDLAQTASRKPENAEEMYLTTAAQEMIYRRELLLARLRERGALAMEVDSRTVSTTLVNSYLEVKQRSQL